MENTENFTRLVCGFVKSVLDGKPGPFPDGAEIIVSAFMDLSRARGRSGIGACPISWEAIAAWSQLMRTPLEPHHVQIIMALDDVWMTHTASRATAPEGVKTLPPVSDHAITAGLLDAMFG